MERCHIDDGNNEALGIDVASIDVGIALPGKTRVQKCSIC